MKSQALSDAEYAAWLAAVKAIRQFEIEVWVILAICLTSILIRILVQMRMRGWKKLQVDDYLVLLAGACFIIECISVIGIDKAGGTSFKMTDAQRDVLTDSQIRMYEKGQKWYMVSSTFYFSTLWVLKGAMLFLFKRVTRGLRQEKLINITGAVVVFSYIILQIILFANCRPWKDFFQVKPQPSQQCQGTSPEYYIPGLVLNIITDLMIMAIPIPLLWQAQLCIGKKIMLTTLFCGGLFIITASTIRTVISLQSLSQTFTTAAWSVREILVAMLVTNAPLIKTIFQPSKSDRKCHPSKSYGTNSIISRHSRHISASDLESGRFSRKGSKDTAIFSDSESTREIYSPPVPPVPAILIYASENKTRVESPVGIVLDERIPENMIMKEQTVTITRSDP